MSLRHPKANWRIAAALATAAAGIITAALLTPPLHTATVRKPAVVSNPPIVLVHGYALNSGCPGGDVRSYWAGLTSMAAKQKLPNSLVYIGYYQCDSNATAMLGTFDTNTDITSVAESLAWWIYDTYTANGQPVWLVGHSMGGLVIRAALQHVAAADRAFPPQLLVPQAESISSPFAGITPAVAASVNCDGSLECSEFTVGSDWLASLGADQDPEGAGGTDWSAIGGGPCDLVTPASATDLLAAHRVSWTSPCYTHTGILTDESLLANSHATYLDPNSDTVQTTTIGYHSVRFALYALSTASW